MATFILKAIEACNSYCAYCEVVRNQHTQTIMELDTLELVFRRIAELADMNPSEDYKIIWHGGEPLLLGKKYFESAVKLHDDILSGYGQVTHLMQSNLTLLDMDYIDFFKQLGIESIGTSYDPGDNIRGNGSSLNSEQYNRLFLRAIELLDSRDIGWGIIYVVTKYSLDRPVELFNLLTNVSRYGGMNLNPVLISRPELKHIAITPFEYADFLGAILPLWLEKKDIMPSVSPFLYLFNLLSGKPGPVGCADSGKCARTHLNFASDGTVSQCGRASDMGVLEYGHIREMSLNEIFSRPEIANLGRRRELLMEGECSGCSIFNLCNGGCPLDAINEYNDYMRKTGWCEFKKYFVNKYMQPVTGMQIEQIDSRGVC